MTLFFPLLDGMAALLWLAGSPSLGYIVLRTAWPSSQAWNGIVRALAATGLGAGWSILAFFALSPGFTNSISIHPNQLAEFSNVLGMGLILLTLFAGLLSRFVWYRFVAPWSPGIVNSTPPAEPDSSTPFRVSQAPLPSLPARPARVAPTLREPVIENERMLMGNMGNEKMENEKTDTAKNNIPPRVYKPSQLKLPPRPVEKSEERSVEIQTKKIPVDSNGNEDADALGLLREEASNEGKSVSSPPAYPAGRRAPISEIGEFAGFDETLTQLKRDLKAFNESVDSHYHSRKKGKGT